jgi:lipoprotein-anchoring transpeptidase ErfK/SrfK
MQNGLWRCAAWGLAAAGLSGCYVVRPRLDVRSRAIGVAAASRARAPVRAAVRGDRLPAARLQIPPRELRALRARPVLRLALPQGRPGIRLVVSIPERRLSLVQGHDTIFQAPVAVASGLTLTYGAQAWRFRTPRGERRVLRKVSNPVWTPPDWHYAEAAVDHGLQLARLPATGTTLTRGRRLVIRNGFVGVIPPHDHFRVLPTDEHIVFDGRLFIPPLGTKNRRITGELGEFALDLGAGYMIHGSSDPTSIGTAVTHGCIRVGDEDLMWLYENVPIGTPVVIR